MQYYKPSLIQNQAIYLNTEATKSTMNYQNKDPKKNRSISYDQSIRRESLMNSKKPLISLNSIESLDKPQPVENMSGKNTNSMGGENKIKIDLVEHNSRTLDPDKNNNIDWDSLELPINNKTVLEKYSKYLSGFEKQEILQFMNVYYIGHKSNKVQSKMPTSISNNFGFDDDKGDYLYQPFDHVAYRYEIHEHLGRGSFGQVLKVYDYKRKEFSALKIIRNKKKFYNQAIIELKILKYIRDNDPNNQMNIVKIKDFVIFRNHVCIIFELLSINLYEFLKNNRFNGVSLELIRRFAIQILQALLFLEKNKIIHCDLKPENILLKQPNKSGIKIVDFGSSCFEQEIIYTYIQSRFYRAPEIILGLPYNIAIDMWSFGCIMAEMYMGYPIFPGENEQEQFQMFMELLDVPDSKFLDICPRKKYFFDSENIPKISQNSIGKIRTPGSKDLNHYLRCPDKNFENFIGLCLQWKSEDRMSPGEALVHDWILEGLPQEIRVQHLLQMQKSAPYLQLQKQLNKYQVNLDQNFSSEIQTTQLSDSQQFSSNIKQKIQNQPDLHVYKVQNNQLKNTSYKFFSVEKKQKNIIRKSHLSMNLTANSINFSSKKKNLFGSTNAPSEDTQKNIVKLLNLIQIQDVDSVVKNNDPVSCKQSDRKQFKKLFGDNVKNSAPIKQRRPFLKGVNNFTHLNKSNNLNSTKNSTNQ